MPTAWGDESVRKTGVTLPMYLMGACVCDTEERIIRNQLSHIKPKNAAKLHWRDMRPSLRMKAIQTIDSMHLQHVIVAAMPLARWNTTERARRKCLEKLLPLLEQEYAVDYFYLEQRDFSQDKEDIRFVDALRSRQFIRSIRVELLAGKSDARLWIPDQLLGAYGDHQAGSSQYEEFLTRVRIIHC